MLKFSAILRLAIHPSPSVSVKICRTGIVSIIGVMFVYMGWWAALYYNQDDLLFPMRHDQGLHPIRYPQARLLKLPIENDGTVEALFVSLPERTPGLKKAPVLIYFHDGNDTIDELDGLMGPYWGMGFSLFLPEYRGYGRSSGEPSQEAIQKDMIRFYDLLVQQPDVDATRIVFHGKALGGAVAANLSRERHPRAMILESTYSSYASMAYLYAAPPFIMRNPFYTDEVVAKFDRPLLIFHGVRDDIVPVKNGRTLRDIANPALCNYYELDCGYRDFPGRDAYKAYWKRIQDFVSQNGSLVAGKPEKLGTVEKIDQLN